MHNQRTRNPTARKAIKDINKKYALIAIIVAVAIFAVLISSSYLSIKNIPSQKPSNNTAIRSINFNHIAEQVYPRNGFVLPVKWDNSARILVNNGALNLSFINYLLNASGQPLTNYELKILNGTEAGNLTINSSTGLFTLYVLWAIGINNKNPIINNGPLMNYGGNPYQLASTGGYGPLGKLQLGNLTILQFNNTQQRVIESVASNVYRPCCNNPALFPDCNHGAAQLGLIELMVSQGSNETKIYNALKEFSSFYFPSQYIEMAVFFNVTQGKAWNQVDAKQILGYNNSSASGYYAIHQYLLSSNTLRGTSGNIGSSCGV